MLDSILFRHCVFLIYSHYIRPREEQNYDKGLFLELNIASEKGHFETFNNNWLTIELYCEYLLLNQL